MDNHLRQLESRAIMEQARKVTLRQDGSASMSVPSALPQDATEQRKRRLPPRPPGWGSDEDATRASLMTVQQLTGKGNGRGSDNG